MITILQAEAKIKKKLNEICPGNPFRLSNAHSVGDGIWQGDLGIEIVKKVPKNYIKIKNPSEGDKQLVPEGGAGSHHRLRSLNDVEIYLPPNWKENNLDLLGPCVVFKSANAIVHEPGHLHPHGTIFIDDKMTVLCRYQRNLDVQTKKERRAAD